MRDPVSIPWCLLQVPSKQCPKQAVCGLGSGSGGLYYRSVAVLTLLVVTSERRQPGCHPWGAAGRNGSRGWLESEPGDISFHGTTQ